MGLRSGSVMPGIDLWDEVNGDRASMPSASVGACRAACDADAGCGAWTFTAVGGGLCRLKAAAHHCLMVVGGSPGCFLPSHGNWSNATSTSGFKQQQGVRFAQLYVERQAHMCTRSALGWRGA